MGDQIYSLAGDARIPVEPVGTLMKQGWMPGTWVKISSEPVTFSGAIATVERSDGTGLVSGIMATGPQHNNPVELLSDMWTTDMRQREGGDTKANWGAIDASSCDAQFDANGQLQRLGSRIATMFAIPSILLKFYVFETFDKAERDNPGTGAALVYTPGQWIYVSGRGRLTNEQESPAHERQGYVVAKVGRDNEGDYVIVCRH
jgi:hypothetical protein